MESNHAAGGNRHFFAGFGVAAGALRFVAQLEIAEAGNFDFFTALKRGADFFKKKFDDFFGVVFAHAADFFYQDIGQLCFGHGHDVTFWKMQGADYR